MALCNLLLLGLPWLVAAVTAANPGCKIRITTKGLELVKQEGLRFVEQELEHISIPDLHGKEGQFQYNISGVKVTDLQLALSNLHFQPPQHLAFNINNASISLRFRGQLLLVLVSDHVPPPPLPPVQALSPFPCQRRSGLPPCWDQMLTLTFAFSYDIGSINASAEGVNVRTLLKLSMDKAGRLKISNITCNASIARMQTGFTGTLRKVYEFLSAFITTGIRFLLNQQICPALHYAGRVELNSLLDTVSVRSPVDEHISIDYSLLSHPVVSPDTLDLDFKGMFYYQSNETLVNQAVAPVIKETERMVYVAFSEYFFNSAMDAYYQAGVLSKEIAGEEVPKDLEVLLRATFFGSIIMLSPAVVDAPLKLVLQASAPPLWTIKPAGTSVSVAAVLNISLVPVDHPAIQLSSMTMDAKLSAKVSLRGKALEVQLDLRRFRIYSKQSALESLALFPLQAPLKTLLQLVIMPILNERTKKGVPIPLPEGMDFTKEIVTSHVGFITVGADLHFSKGLREVIEKYKPAQASRPPSPEPTTPAGL
ncbi:Phospholipid transfer protein [Chelonia mydas]|uniref:Phospholipid transfer protein n=1 Tax=Chelonia mydas TaxID=8469 RepID=M7BJA2_CHEMY|nr:Phospholipid transfer protein [Chelonia mydas]